MLGAYRVRPEIEVSSPVPDLINLPGKEASNFISASPMHIGDKSMYRVFGGTAGDRGSYWTDSPIPSTEGAWRSKYAVTREWGNTGEKTAEWSTPASQWAWGGKASPQAVKGYSDKLESFGAKFRYGWIQKGGDYQAYVPNSYKVISQSAVDIGVTPWKK